MTTVWLWNSSIWNSFRQFVLWIIGSVNHVTLDSRWHSDQGSAVDTLHIVTDASSSTALLLAL